MADLTPALRARIVAWAKRYAPCLDAEEIGQQVLVDCWHKPWLAEPENEPQLRQRIRFRVLTALRTERRRRARESRYAIEDSRYAIEESL
jgi:hypothetical protein